MRSRDFEQESRRSGGISKKKKAPDLLPSGRIFSGLLLAPALGVAPAPPVAVAGLIFSFRSKPRVVYRIGRLELALPLRIVALIPNAILARLRARLDDTAPIPGAVRRGM
jgi:hypothetical protein